MIDTKKRNSLVRKWLREHGGAQFDFKNKDVVIHDGSIFSITKEIKMMNKIKGTVPCGDGTYQVEFSKKKVPTESYKATLWFEEIDETIRWLQSMRDLLQSVGYATSHCPKTTESCDKNIFKS